MLNGQGSCNYMYIHTYLCMYIHLLPLICAGMTVGCCRSLLARKKPCPSCGFSVARKSKKCHHCGKSFGVFTFGRRLCTRCNHINLARMHACFKCGLSLEKAPTAFPKDVEGTVRTTFCQFVLCLWDVIVEESKWLPNLIFFCFVNFILAWYILRLFSYKIHHIMLPSKILALYSTISFVKFVK